MGALLLYAFTGFLLFILGFRQLIVQAHLLRKIMAANIMGAGIFMILIAMAARRLPPDPVPHAMVLTGIVVAVSVTAFALTLTVLVHEFTGRSTLSESDDGDKS